MNKRRNQPRRSSSVFPRRTSSKPSTPGAFLGTIRAIFIAGPVLLITSQLSVRAAIFMITGVLPGLLCPAVLLVPSFLFPSPQSHSYYYFSEMLNNDPAIWLPVALSAVCTIATLGMPACAFRAVFKPVKG